MIDLINKEIITFLSSIDIENTQAIKDKYTTSISEDLNKGHITTNVCMVAGSILKSNPKELAEKLKKKLIQLQCFEDVVSAGPGFINIFLKRKDFVSSFALESKIFLCISRRSGE